MIGVRDPIPGVVYPRAELLTRYVEAGELPERTLAEALWDSFDRHADKAALVTAEGDLTYRELDMLTDRLAAALLNLGLQPLDRVLFQSGNCAELTFALLACFKAGLIPVCTLSAHREREMGYLGPHTDARVWIVQGDDPKFDHVAFAKRMATEIPTLRHVITLRGDGAGVPVIAQLIEGEDATAARRMLEALPRDPYQVALFQLSGGTTGTPKVIPRMHNDYLLNALLTIDCLGYRSDDVTFNPMQIIHNACMICFWLPSMLIGATFLIAPDMTPEGWAALFRRRAPTYVGLIRPLLPRFDAALAEAPEMLRSIRAFWSPDSSQTVRRAYKRPSYAMFGMSEGLNMYVRPGDPDEAADWTVGRPMSRFDEVRLVQPGTNTPVGLDEIGELTCRGPYTLAGYYNAPERNREAFTEDGFYRTGDLLISRNIDGAVYYAFAGRTKDVVDRGTEKVNCEEVEDVVMSHPDISGCAVVGMPDPLLGERVCAFVTLRGAGPAPDVPSMQRHLEAAGLAKFKWPERIEAIDALPVGKSGKLDKAVLRAEIIARMERSEPALAAKG